MTGSSEPLRCTRPTGPLAGLRVLDISTVIAGPFAATMLADLGADVLKVEMPGAGDALRRLAPHKEGVPLWWKVTNRNKKGITLDLRKPEGKALLGRLVAKHDVLVENFRTGTLDEWGITRSWLQDINPRLTILRVTGFGQTGPYRSNPGFARVFEAMSGFTRMCGEEGGTPLHLGYPISDPIGGLFGAHRNARRTLSAQERSRRPRPGDRLLGHRSDDAHAGISRHRIRPARRGSHRERQPQPVCRARQYLRDLRRQMGLDRGIDAKHLRAVLHGARTGASDRRIRVSSTIPSRVKNYQAIDAIVSDAISRLTLDELRSRLHAHEVGFSPIYDASDVFADPHFIARKAIVSVPDHELGDIRMQCVVPRFSETAGLGAPRRPFARPAQ